jgi:hypothetical protein
VNDVLYQHPCGCIGLAREPDGTARVLVPCDNEGNGSFEIRSVMAGAHSSHQESVRLSDERSSEIWDSHARLFRRGKDMEKFRLALLDFIKPPVWTGAKEPS